MLGAEYAAPVINARSELPLSLSSDTTVPQGTADVNTQGSTEYTPLRMPTLDAEGAANEVEMPVISENAPADRKAAQFDIIRQSNPFDAELGNHTWIKFQSTPPARGATSGFAANAVGLSISIHAPREGGDRAQRAAVYPAVEFQSTPPARGATLAELPVNICLPDFNPRPPRGGRLATSACCSGQAHFNPRPREGGDPQPVRGRCVVEHFNPRPPRGGRLEHSQVRR